MATDFEKSKAKKIIILLLKIFAIEECLTFIFSHYFFEITPYTVTPAFVVALIALIGLNWYTKVFQRKDYFKPAHIPLIIITLFLAVHFRAGIVWALNTFPLRDANMVMLTLQEPFDDFAYLMIKQYLATSIPQALVITAVLSVFLYALFNSTRKRIIGIATYFIATIAFLISDIPLSDYIHILNDEPEKNATYSEFFVQNYVNPDSVKITPPEKKRNLILIYLESLETSFADKEHGGNQSENLIPEITDLALQNISFGRTEKYIGGGLDALGSSSTFTTFHTRSLGIPNVISYTNTPILHHYKSLYKILNENGYEQIFVQGNFGLYKQFHYFSADQKIDEIYGPDDLKFLLNLDSSTIKRHRMNTVQDKETIKFAKQILDTISEPFSLTVFTIDTHAPHGIYDPDCVKASDENNEDELLKASAKCVSRELNDFLTSLKSKPFYDNTSIVVFGDHRFMGTRLVKDSPNRKWVNIFINTQKDSVREKNRLFSDIDMFPTILSAIHFEIEGNRLGFGTNLFSEEKTLIENIGLDSLNKAIDKIGSHLIYESYLFEKSTR